MTKLLTNGEDTRKNRKHHQNRTLDSKGESSENYKTCGNQMLENEIKTFSLTIS